MVVGVLLAVVCSVGISAGVSYAIVKTVRSGPAGPQGEQGPAGPQGPSAELDDEDVWDIVESDPDRVTQLVEPNLDPAPADVADDLETVTQELSSLCSDLEFSDALANDVLVCP
jgi:hypothetical protein